MEVVVRCELTYLPMDARIDRVSFENLMKEVQPRVLILVNGYETKLK